MGYQKAVVKYLQTWIQTLTPIIFKTTTRGMDKGKLFFFIAQQNEVILKRHDTVNLCYICDRLSCGEGFI